MNKGTILSVDDDEDLQTVIGQYLEDDGYRIIKASTVAKALEQAASHELDVVLLDLVLPDGEGLVLIPQLQSKTGAGIIVVSGKSDTTEKIVCLEMGADDYITKPFEMRELSARIRAVLRRRDAGPDFGAAQAAQKAAHQNAAPKQAEQIFFEGGWCLDRNQYQLFDDKKRSAALTTGEFKLLEALVLSANRALSREHLFDLTRDGEFEAYDRAIDIQIARLRKKLGDDAKPPRIIKTVRGVGYMFCGVLDKG